MNTDEAETLVRTCLHEVAPDTDLDTLRPDADLRETLHLDSLDFLQVVELLSDRGHSRIDEDDYPQLTTLASTVAFLTNTPH